MDMPAPQTLRDLYVTARDGDHVPTQASLREFQGIVGVLIYVLPCVRVDVAQPIGMLSRALTFPTPELLAVAYDVLVYLAQTADVGVVYDGNAPDAGVLVAYCDSDWPEGHGTTGYAIVLAGAVIGYASKRQPIIAMSSTEAEIVAASACATEIVFFRSLLAEMGLPQDDPTKLHIDNQSCILLSRDRKSCHKSRHGSTAASSKCASTCSRARSKPCISRPS